MTLIRDMMVMPAVLWERSATPDRSNRYTYEAAVEVLCFWTASNEQFSLPDGKTIVARSEVYIDRAIKPGDMLKQCSLDDLESGASVSNDPERYGADEVRVFDVFPDWDNNEKLYRAVL